MIRGAEQVVVTQSLQQFDSQPRGALSLRGQVHFELGVRRIGIVDRVRIDDRGDRSRRLVADDLDDFEPRGQLQLQFEDPRSLHVVPGKQRQGQALRLKKRLDQLVDLNTRLHLLHLQRQVEGQRRVAVRVGPGLFAQRRRDLLTIDLRQAGAPHRFAAQDIRQSDQHDAALPPDSNRLYAGHTDDRVVALLELLQLNQQSLLIVRG